MGVKTQAGRLMGMAGKALSCCCSFFCCSNQLFRSYNRMEKLKFEYPTNLVDMVAIGYRSPTSRTLNVIPSRGGDYTLSIQPTKGATVGGVNCRVSWNLAFPPGTAEAPIPQAKEFDLISSIPGLTPDIRSANKAALKSWSWTLQGTRALIGMINRRTSVASGVFEIVASGDDSGSTVVAPTWAFWSCNSPFTDTKSFCGCCGGKRPKINSESKSIFKWYRKQMDKHPVQLVYSLGDAAYADPSGMESLNFSETLVETLDAWGNTEEGRTVAHNLFRNMYAHSWSFKPFARVLGSKAHVFTWDDHEIRDGWGSRGASDVLDAAPVLQVARDVAEEFTLGLGPRVRAERTADAHMQVIQDPVAMFMFDSRSSRQYKDDKDTRLDVSQVVGPAQFEDFKAYLAQIQARSTTKLLLLGVSVPLVAIARWVVATGANIPDWLNSITGDLRDDVRDTFSAPGNAEQLAAIIEELRGFVTARPDIQIVVLSGDLHVSNAFTFQPPGFPTPCYQITTSSLTNRVLGPKFLRNIFGAPDSFDDPILGQVNRVWKDIDRPNVLIMAPEGTNKYKFSLKVHKRRLGGCCTGTDENDVTLTLG